ncbi:MAG: (2Fe-2S)-binding protein [Myxococcales bacterium]|nr:(2Fe-2S)-binding protein [Myxococcales bacterium]
MKTRIAFALNGAPVEVEVPPMARLLDVLREDVRATGTKEGCGEGECGACTVLIDGRAVNSCLVPVVQVRGARVQTVEGLAKDGRLHPVQQAFLDHGGAQCGICTPGFLVAAAELLDRNATPDAAEVREALAGNLCRCTGYQKIVDAVVAAYAKEGA